MLLALFVRTWGEKNIAKIAPGCLKPCRWLQSLEIPSDLPCCRYLKYRLVSGPQASVMAMEGTMLLGLVVADTDIQLDSELLNYSARSLIAEVGGTLGLFVGFSFIALWDRIAQYF